MKNEEDLKNELSVRTQIIEFKKGAFGPKGKSCEVKRGREEEGGCGPAGGVQGGGLERLEEASREIVQGSGISGERPGRPGRRK